MKQEQFLQELGKELAPLSDEERARALGYFHELICDGVENGEDEQTLIAGFGSVKEVAARIFEEGRASASVQIQPIELDGRAPFYTTEKPVQIIRVDTRNTAVELVPTADGPVQVYFEPGENDRVECREENGVFSFFHRIPFSLLHWRDWFRKMRRITVQVPAAFAGSMEIQTSNVRLTAKGFSALSAGRFATSNGNLTLSNLVCRDLTAHTANGRIDLQQLEGDCCRAETSNGRVCAEHCVFPSGLALSSHNGMIRATGVVSDAIEYSTSNGKIESTIVGDMRDYAIHSHTSNASNTLPPTFAFPDQTKRLDVNTSNGKIDIRFESAQ